MCASTSSSALRPSTPTSIALEWGGNQLTYAELVSYSDQIARWLRVTASATDSSVVALQLHRSLEQVVALLGVLASGKAYLPLDPKWPLERRAFVVDDAACGVLVAQSEHAVHFEGWYSGAILRLDDCRAVTLSSASSNSSSSSSNSSSNSSSAAGRGQP